MADYTVVKTFTCKLSKKRYNPGETYSTADPERAQLLIRKKRIKSLPELKTRDDAPVTAKNLKHVGGGNYELPNGDRVKGKEAAASALTEFTEED